MVEYRKPHMYALQIYFQPFLERVFTSDGVVVGVMFRSVERYELVKIKTMELDGGGIV